MKINLKIFYPLLVLAITGCGSTQTVLRSQTVADEYMTSLQLGKYQDVVELQSDKAQAGNNAKSVSQFWQKIEKKRGKMQGFSRTKVENYNGDRTHVNYDVQFSKSVGHVEVTTDKENGITVVTDFLIDK